METPPPEIKPDDPSQLPPARRRRAKRRLIAVLSTDERAQYLETAGQRAKPSFDFFLYSLLCGAVITIGIMLDSPHVVVLGALLTPRMAPVVGLSLGSAIGSSKIFLRSLGGLLVGAFLVVLVGALGGTASQLWPATTNFQAHIHTQFNLYAFILAGVAVPVTCAALLRDRYTPAVFSMGIGYVLFTPLAAAGFGLGSGREFLWPDGVVVFAVLLVWGTLLGTLTLTWMGFRPYSLLGYTMSGALLLIGVLIGIGALGAGAVVVADLGVPTQVPTPTHTLTPTATYTPSPEPPTPTRTPTITPKPTETPTYTPSPTPTPVLARVQVVGEQGVFLRSEPVGDILTSLLNGTLVEILPEPEETINGAVWVKVLVVESGLEGWILRSLLVTATPGVETPVLPSSTPTATP